MSIPAPGRPRGGGATPTTPSGGRRWLQGLALATAVAALIGATLSFTAARSSLAEAADDRRQWDLAGLQLELSWLYYDLLQEGLAAEHGGRAEPLGFEGFLDRQAELIDRIEHLADAPDALGDRAAAFLDSIDPDLVDGWPTSAEQLEHLHWTSLPFADIVPTGFDESGFDVDGEFPAEFTGGFAVETFDGGPTYDWLIDAADQVMIPALVLGDALAVELTRRPAPVAPWAREYVDDTAEVVADAPGWVGPDRTQPLAGNLIGGDLASLVPTIGPALDRALPALQVTWDYDQWLIAGATRGRPPATIAELGAATERSTIELRAALLDEVARSGDAAEAEARGLGRWLPLAVGIACSLVVLALAGIALRSFLHRNRHLADALYTDALTGSANRRFLDERVAATCRQADRVHLVAMLDMDRFKMVNDTWGHDAGDALLQVLASRLQEQVDELGRVLPRATGSVVRLGGDEFVVALHAAGPIDHQLVESRIRRVAGPVDIGVEEPIELAFSLGLAISDRPVELADLLKTADLATYEDKRRRSEQRTARPTVDPAPTGR